MKRTILALTAAMLLVTPTAALANPFVVPDDEVREPVWSIDPPPTDGERGDAPYWASGFGEG